MSSEKDDIKKLVDEALKNNYKPDLESYGGAARMNPSAAASHNKPKDPNKKK